MEGMEQWCLLGTPGSSGEGSSSSLSCRAQVKPGLSGERGAGAPIPFLRPPLIISGLDP